MPFGANSDQHSQSSAHSIIFTDHHRSPPDSFTPPSSLSFPTPPSSFSHTSFRTSSIKRRLIESDDEIEDATSDEDCPIRPPNAALFLTQPAASLRREGRTGETPFLPSPGLAAQVLAQDDSDNDDDDYSILNSDDEAVPPLKELDTLHIGPRTSTWSEHDILDESSDEDYRVSRLTQISDTATNPAEQGSDTDILSDGEDDEATFKHLQAGYFEKHARDARHNSFSGHATTSQHRRQRALAFLESLPLSLLTQLTDSLASITNHKVVRAKRLFPQLELAFERHRKKDKGFLDSNSEEESQMAGERRKKKKQLPKLQRPEIGVDLRLRNRSTGADQVISWPDDPVTYATNHQEPAMHKFACILRVASLMYEIILSNGVSTKRDIFYKDVALFKSQRIVDAIVDDLAASAGLKRQDFHVGLIASTALKVWLKSGEELSFSGSNPSLIPPVERIDHLEADEEINWVLIVEKDAVFQTLCRSLLLADSTLGPGVLVTGKGYPDLATLQLLALVRDSLPTTRFYALVDADPHGLDILSVYKYGSKATRFSHDHSDLALGDRLEWMGVKASDWRGLGIDPDSLLPLTDRDVQKSVAMLRDRHEMELSWRQELQRMLHLHRKAEIQVILSADPSLMPATLTKSQSSTEGDATDRAGKNMLVAYIQHRLLRS